jgi:WD40 repeat protein
MKTLKGHTDEVVCLQFDVESQKLVSGGFDQSIRMWNVITGKCEKVFRGHTDWVYSLAVVGNQIISGSGDTTMKVIIIIHPLFISEFLFTLDMGV